MEGVYCVQFSAKHFSPYGMVINESPKDIVQTGDSQEYIPFAILAIVSLITLLAVSRKRKNKIIKKA